jgi:NAD(P)-dependent dehydrogenase (short-subunit alcohol dehydrogenase family)
MLDAGWLISRNATPADVDYPAEHAAASPRTAARSPASDPSDRFAAGRLRGRRVARASSGLRRRRRARHTSAREDRAMDLGLTGKVALVTGASRGIGRAIAEALAREGCDLVAAARSGERLQELAETLGRDANRRVIPCVADLSGPDGVARAVGTAEQEFRRLDILVNNAGSTRRGDVFALTEADWREGFALKFFGYVRMIRASWPLLKAARGAVVNIIGIGGRTPGAEFAIGGSVNAGLLAFTKTMAEIGIRDGVRVNAINPGAIETDRLLARLRRHAEETGMGLEEARQDLAREMGVERFGRAAEIGDAAAFLASARAHYLQGALIDIDGGATRTL